jgi:CheY-like chemotaxis protein
LADDSAAIQKVIDLTFSDEGMNVTTVGDGRSALAELEQYPPPDVILADVFMPEPGGYELCRQIKENERFSQIPVILLVSSFEPFDQAEADRVGADDIVTKPFQSIRQLVSRVGALVGGQHGRGDASPEVSSMLESERTEPQLADALSQEHPPHNVTVLVEAPVMENHVEQGPACAVDVDAQTADTRPLQRVSDEPAETATTDEWRFEDTMEVEPAADYEIPNVDEVMPEEAVRPVVAAEAHEPMRQETYSVRVIDEALLDLDDEFIAQEPAGDDVFLDVEFEEPTQTLSPPTAPEFEAPSAVAEAEVEAIEAPMDEPKAEFQQWSSTAPAFVQPTPEVSGDRDEVAVDESVANLSPQQIDMIAQKVVERLSDKAVRDIAWEVVPELAELLITRRLDEQK